MGVRGPPDLGSSSRAWECRTSLVAATTRSPYPAVEESAGVVRPRGRAASTGWRMWRGDLSTSGERRSGGRPRDCEAHSTQEDPCDVRPWSARSSSARWPLSSCRAPRLRTSSATTARWRRASPARWRSTPSGWSSPPALVMFMQAGFAFLEIGFSRGKNAGTVVAKILTNFSIAGLCYWAVGFAFAFGAGSVIGHHGFFLQGFGDPLKAFPVMGLSGRDGRVEVVLPVRLLRRLAGDRVGHDARAHQVRRLHHLRGRLRVDHLPDRLALGLRRRLPADGPLARHGHRRHAGLRRLDGRPPDRRHRRVRRAAAARPAQGQVRRGRQAAGHPRPQHAAVRARRADPVARLVRVQPRARP